MIIIIIKSNYKQKKDMNLLGLTCQTYGLGNETKITWQKEKWKKS